MLSYLRKVVNLRGSTVSVLSWVQMALNELLGDVPPSRVVL